MTEATRINSKSVRINASAGALRHRTGTAAGERSRSAQHERTSAPVIVKKRVKAKPFPVRFVFYAAVITVMLMFVVYGNSVMNELSYEYNSLKSEIATLEHDNDNLQIQIDKKYDLDYVERVATEELGLVKSTEVVKHYVNISGGDKVVVSGNTDKSGAVSDVDTTFDSLN